MTREVVINLEDIVLYRNLKCSETTDDLSDDQSSKPQFTCNICKATFSTSLSMKKHKALHDDTDAEEDILEQKKLPESKTESSHPPKKDSLRETVPIIPNGESLPTQQGKNAKPAEPKKKKKKAKKAPKVTNFKCDSCNVYFDSSNEAKTHRIHKKVDKCKFACNICNRKFNKLYAFVVHIMQHNFNATKGNTASQTLFICDTCQKPFKDSASLRSHEIHEHISKFHKNPHIPEVAVATPTVETNFIKLEPQSPVMQAPTYSEAPVGDQSSEFCCELCYDVFTSEEQLKAHIDFHEQLEKKSETILIEDDGDDVEVYEEKKDTYEIVIKSKPKKPEQIIPDGAIVTIAYTKPVLINPNEPVHIPSDALDTVERPKSVSSHPNVHKRRILSDEEKGTVEHPKQAPLNLTVPVQALTDKADTLKDPKPVPLNRSVPVQNLTDEIKNMLAPKLALPAQTIFIQNPASNVREPVRKSPKLVPKTSMRVRGTSNLELEKTGPYSFALHYKPGNSSGSNSTARVGMQNSLPTPPAVDSAKLPPSGCISSNTAPTYTTTFAKNSKQNIGKQTAVTSASNQATGNITSNANMQMLSIVPYMAGLATSSTLATTSVTTCAANVASSTSSALPTNSASSNSSNVTYVIAPPNQFTAPIVVKDPKTQLAYVILPHAQSNTTTMVPNQRSESGSTAPNCTILKTTNTVAYGSNVSTSSAKEKQKNKVDASGTTIIPSISTPSIKETEKDNPEASSSTESAVDVSATNAKLREPLNDENVIVIDDSDENPDYSLADDNEKDSDDESIELVIDESSLGTEEPIDANPTDLDTEGSSKEKPEKKLRLLECESCSVVFRRLRSMRKHKERMHQCKLCDFRCCKVTDFKEHYILQHRKFYCFRCSFLADTKTTFAEHNKSQHICETCNGYYFNLVIHMCPKASNSAKNKKKSENKGKVSAEDVVKSS